jgi:hypothetical protein
MTRSVTASPSVPAEVGMRSLSWSKRFALAGFLFFLGKGLLWLVVLAAAWRLH